MTEEYARDYAEAHVFGYRGECRLDSPADRHDGWEPLCQGRHMATARCVVPVGCVLVIRVERPYYVHDWDYAPRQHSGQVICLPAGTVIELLDPGHRPNLRRQDGGEHPVWKVTLPGKNGSTPVAATIYS